MCSGKDKSIPQSNGDYSKLIDRYYLRLYGVAVSTGDFESPDPGSNPGTTSFLFIKMELFSLGGNAK